MEETPGFAEFLTSGVFFNFVPRGHHLERLLLKTYGIANDAFYWLSLFCIGDSLQEQGTRCDIENWGRFVPAS